MRLVKSTGDSVQLTILPPWPVNVLSADPSGNVEAVLPYFANGTYDRPVKIHFVYTNQPNLTPEAILGSSPHATINTPGVGILGNDIHVSARVEGPLPTGQVTVLAILEFN